VARSASLVIAYVMRTLRVDLQTAYGFVRSKAPAVMPDVGMMGRLVELETAWFGEGGFEKRELPPGTPSMSLMERVDRRVGGDFSRTPGLMMREGTLTPTGERAGRGMSPVRVSFARSFSPGVKGIRSASAGYKGIRGSSMSPPPPGEARWSPVTSTPASGLAFSPIEDVKPERGSFEPRSSFEARRSALGLNSFSVPNE